jgi:hypothetical protein
MELLEGEMGGISPSDCRRIAGKISKAPAFAITFFY